MSRINMWWFVVPVLATIFIVAGLTSPKATNVAIEHASTDCVIDAIDYRFTVKGMSCGNCASGIEQMAGKIDGVISCEVSFEDGAATVTSADPQVVDRVLATLGEAYDVQLATE